MWLSCTRRRLSDSLCSFFPYYVSSELIAIHAIRVSVRFPSALAGANCARVSFWRGELGEQGGSIACLVVIASAESHYDCCEGSMVSI